MKRVIISVIFLLSFVNPVSGQSVNTCPSGGVAVFYINGMLAESESDIRLDTQELRNKYRTRYSNGDKVTFATSYNPSRFSGVGDLIKAIAQSGESVEPYQRELTVSAAPVALKLYDPGSVFLQNQIVKRYVGDNYISYDRDLAAMIETLATQVRTDKIVLVGHSQGTFYANALYHHLVRNGVPPQSIAVFNIATPAAYVAGAGDYFTATNDAVINEARAYQEKFFGYGALPGKAYLPLSLKEMLSGEHNGHGFREVYLDAKKLHTYDDYIIDRLHYAISTRVSGPAREECVPSVPASGKIAAVVSTGAVVAGYAVSAPIYVGYFLADGVKVVGSTIGDVLGSTLIATKDMLFAAVGAVPSTTQGGQVIASVTPQTPPRSAGSSPIELATYFPQTEASPSQPAVPVVDSTQAGVRVQQPTSSFPTLVAFVPDVAQDEPQHVHTPGPLVPPPIATPLPTNTNPGNLSSLAFGSGAGGGGGTADIRQETAPLADIRLESRSIEAPTCTPNETLDSATNTCVPLAPTCISPQVLDALSNTCIDPAPTTPITPACAETEELNDTDTACVAKVVPVACSLPHTRDTTTNTCILPSQTGPTLLPDSFTADTALTYASSPYISKSEGAQTITIPTGITVTIEPGALVKLATETKLVVEGTLLVQGTSAYTVTITSLYDDTVLPVTSTDTALTPTTHPWSYLDVRSGGTLTASYTTLAYGGWSGFGASATIRNAGITQLSHITISHSQTSGLLHSAGTLTTDALTVDGATTGLALLASQYDIAHTNISHTQTAATLASLVGKITHTTGTDNTTNALVFSSQNIHSGETAHLYPNTLSYYTESTHTVDGTLILHPGVFVQHADTKYSLTGTITAAEGEAGDTPVFTSLWDNTLTGETRGTTLPTASRAPKAGDWFGVVGGTVSGVEQKYNKQ